MTFSDVNQMPLSQLDVKLRYIAGIKDNAR
jgi:hypothetical protein